MTELTEQEYRFLMALLEDALYAEDITITDADLIRNIQFKLVRT